VILIVEDQTENIDLLRAILGREFRLQIAKTGRDALHIIAKRTPDLILLDVGLPDMDGFAVYDNMRALANSRHLPVIFITASTDEQAEKVGLEMGAVDYIYKPYRPAIILNRVRNQLELHEYRRSLEENVAKRTRELQETRKGLLSSLALATDCRDAETGAHIERTRVLISEFIEKIIKAVPQLAELVHNELFVEASLLHDIGKIGIPDKILLKPGGLTVDEYEIMKQHPIIGRTLLLEASQKFPNNRFLKIAVDMASYHHERWDGSGYPYGLKGTEIPLSARIMAIVDVYEALTANRVYRKAMTHGQAVEIMSKGNGTTSPNHFDPELLQLFIESEALREIV
jgi:putative two-component system response regulator